MRLSLQPLLPRELVRRRPNIQDFQPFHHGYRKVVAHPFPAMSTRLLSEKDAGTKRYQLDVSQPDPNCANGPFQIYPHANSKWAATTADVGIPRFHVSQKEP